MTNGANGVNDSVACLDDRNGVKEMGAKSPVSYMKVEKKVQGAR